MKRILRILAVAVVLLLVVALALPFLVDANQFRPLLQTKLSGALGREVTLGGLQLSIFSGAVTASDVSIADDPAFSKMPFLRAKTLAIGVDLMPLILSRKLNVTGITVQNPEIDLIQTPAGEWNFSNLGAKPSVSPAPSALPPASTASPPAPTAAPTASALAASTAPDLSVDLVKISDGRLTLTKTGAKAKPLILDKVNIEVKGFSAESSFPFSLAVSLPGGGALKLDGKAGPINVGDAVATPFDANLHVTHLDLVLSGILGPSAGVGGLVSIDGNASSSGSAVKVTGKLKGEQLKLVKGGLPAKPPAELDIAMTHDLKKQTGTLSRADIHLGKAVATLSGTYNLQNETPAVNLTLVGKGLALTELAAFLPALDVVLPAGASIDKGTANLNITAEGPLDRLAEAGTIDLEGTRLVNYDLGTKLKVLEALAGIKAAPHTEIQTFSANVKAGLEGTNVQDLNLVVPSIGTITGAGTVSPAHALDFKMRVALRSGMGAIAGMGSKGGIPFTIQGTSSDPSFKPDVKGLVTDKIKDLTGDGSSAAGAAENLIHGLFGGKKKPQ
jgi:AsmA protein